MTGLISDFRRAVSLWGALPLLWVALASGCGGGERLVSAETPLAPIDSVTPPGDSLPSGPGPLIPPAPQDTLTPPVNPDSVPLPPPPPPPPSPPGTDSAAPPAAPPTGPPPEHEGLAFGPFHLPMALYGPDNTATLRTAHPLFILADLEAARRAGARVMLGLVGNDRRYKDDKGHFSMAKWKQRVDRYRGLDLSSYIEDGTVIGHYIMDEPHDPENWAGKLVTRAEIDEMARYSKEIWPSMTTIIRSWPDYLKGYDYKYLDAAWAQYSDRFGNIEAFINDNVREARSAGLALVVGLNVLDGGNKDGGIRGHSGGRYAMTASQVKSWGSALMETPGICAYLNWMYEERYFSRSDIMSALEELKQKAKRLPNQSCAR